MGLRNLEVRTGRLLSTTGFALLLSLLGAVRNSSAQERPEPPVLHVLLVTDTDSNLGAHVALDSANLRRILSEGFATRPHRLKLTEFKGAEATREKVLAHYAALRGTIAAKDSLLFYYSGHGAADDSGQFLALEHDRADRAWLYRSRLREAMAACSPRQMILLTDCCSKEVTRAPAEDPPAVPKATWPVMDCLFFHHAGVTDINGCQQDAFSWIYDDGAGAPRGSTFTLALVPLLCAKLNEFPAKGFEVTPATVDFVTWEVFSGRLGEDTDRYFQIMRRSLLERNPNHEVRDQSRQIPQLFSLAEKSPQTIVDNHFIFGSRIANARRGSDPVVILLEVYPGTPAAGAGLRVNDVMESVDGRPIRDREEFIRAIEHSDGDVSLIVWREGTRFRKDVTLKTVKPAPR